MDAVRPNSPYPRTPIYGGRALGTCLVASGAGGLRKAGCSLLAAPLLNLRGGWLYLFTARLNLAIYTLSVGRGLLETIPLEEAIMGPPREPSEAGRVGRVGAAE